jgi:NAD(P) transhydrogenase subunit alpha
MYAKNISTLLLNMTKEGQLDLNMEDEITSGSMVAHQGEITNPMVREAMGIKEA